MPVIASKIGFQSKLYYCLDITTPVWNLLGEITDDELSQEHDAVETSSRATNGQATFAKGLATNEIACKYQYASDDDIWNFLEDADDDIDTIYYIARTDVPIADVADNNQGKVYAMQVYGFKDARGLKDQWNRSFTLKQCKNSDDLPMPVNAL